jgi:hypothetical protein
MFKLSYRCACDLLREAEALFGGNLLQTGRGRGAALNGTGEDGGRALARDPHGRRPRLGRRGPDGAPAGTIMSLEQAFGG